MKKILILGRKSRSTRLLLSVLIASGYNTVFIEEHRDDKGKLLLNRLKRIGFFTVLGQLLFMVFARIQARRATVQSRLEEIEVETVSVLVEQSPISSHGNVNDISVITQIEKIDPDCIILSGTRILSLEFLSKINKPIINIHAGITPAYRGVHGGYWSLVNNQAELFGTTIHFVDEGIDTGSVLEQATSMPKKNDNFSTYPLLQMSAALKLLPSILTKIFNNEEDVFVPKLSSAIWSHPTLWQYIYNRQYLKIK